MTVDSLLLLALALVGAILIAWIIIYLRVRRRVRQLESENRSLQDEIERRMDIWQEKEELRRRFTEQLAGLARQSLSGDRDSGERLSNPSKQSRAARPSSTEVARDTAIETGWEPLHTALERAERHIRRSEQEREHALAAFSSELAAAATSQPNAHAQEPRASAADDDRTPDQGLSLQRLARLAGVGEYCEWFALEATGATVRADPTGLAVAMPGAERMVIVGFAAAAGTTASATRNGHAEWAASIRAAAERIADDAFQRRFEPPPRFLVLYVPTTRLLQAALDADPTLQDTASRAGIILSTPADLVALLRMVRLGWHQHEIARNAEQMRREALELYHRITVFSSRPKAENRSADADLWPLKQAPPDLPDPDGFARDGDEGNGGSD